MVTSDFFFPQNMANLAYFSKKNPFVAFALESFFVANGAKSRIPQRVDILFSHWSLFCRQWCQNWPQKKHIPQRIDILFTNKNF
jgi:hypothetical protein